MPLPHPPLHHSSQNFQASSLDPLAGHSPTAGNEKVPRGAGGGRAVMVFPTQFNF